MCSKDPPMADTEDICFVDPNWLAQNVLSADTSLEYFSNSPFYDRTCNNEVLKMQSKFREVSQDQLRNMVGIEYLVSKPDPVITIEKVHRFSPTRTETRGVFYMIHGYIYAAPSMKKVFASRLTNALFHLNKALDLYMERRTFSPFTGFTNKSHKGHFDADENNELRVVLEIVNDHNLRNDSRQV